MFATNAILSAPPITGIFGTSGVGLGGTGVSVGTSVGAATTASFGRFECGSSCRRGRCGCLCGDHDPALRSLRDG
ncbi:MAG: hypothetical protein MZV64_58885 [Ignavibacteriales bacterium]|nr:hypothetical protein [Ignavibacteriales bacterium]